MHSTTMDNIYAASLILGPLTTGLIQHSYLEKISQSWHTSLHKSAYRPPGIVFPIVWTWAYLSIGWSSYMLRQQAPCWLTCLYISHWLLLHSWGIMVLAAHRLDIGLVIMIGLDILVMLMLPTIAKLQPFVALVLLPYPLWLGLLTYLNWFMWKWNPMASLKKN